MNKTYVGTAEPVVQGIESFLGQGPRQVMPGSQHPQTTVITRMANVH